LDLSGSTSSCSTLDDDVVMKILASLPDHNGFDYSNILAVPSTTILNREVSSALEYAHRHGLKKVHVIGYSSPLGQKNKPGNPAAGIPAGSVLELAPFNVNTDALTNWARKYRDGGTRPHLALQALTNAAPHWLKEPATTEIVFVCDGQIERKSPNCDAPSEFQNEINKITTKYPDVRVTILSVSDERRIYNGETGVAGADIFDALGGAGATRVSFYGYAPNYPLGVELYKSRTVPEGYIPFGTKMFKISDEHMFHKHMVNVLSDATDDNIMDIMRNLVAAVSRYITVTSPSAMDIISITNGYRTLFDLCANLIDEDPLELKELFDSMIKLELAGKIQSAVAYSANKKARFADATRRLIKDVTSAIGARSDEFMTFPLKNDDGFDVYLVNKWDLNAPFVVSDGNRTIVYKNGAFKDTNGNTAPVFSRHFHKTPAAEQAQRQFLRAVAAHETGFDCRSDMALAFMLCRCIQIINTPSDVPQQMREAYIRMAVCLLKKTCAGSECVEYNNIRDGNFYSGRTFKQDLVVGFNAAFGFSADWEHIWYTICRSLGDELLLSNQLRLLKMRADDVDAIFASIVGKCPVVKIVTIPTRSERVYECIMLPFQRKRCNSFSRFHGRHETLDWFK